MSLRHHQIECAVIAFDVEQDDQVIGRISMPARPALTMTKTETDIPKISKRVSMRERVGFGMVRTGVAVLSIPDPLPFIDEGIGIGLVAGGAALIYTEQ